METEFDFSYTSTNVLLRDLKEAAVNKWHTYSKPLRDAIKIELKERKKVCTKEVCEACQETIKVLDEVVFLEG